MSTEHLILGETKDFITGKTITDTHDERARQKIARFLVEKKGYEKGDIEIQRKIPLLVDGKKAFAKLDFVVKVEGKVFAVIKFGPGSMVTRQRPTLAAARLVEDYEVPLAVITNGQDAEIMETKSGKVIGRGLESIWSKTETQDRVGRMTFEKIEEHRLEKEQRILYVFEVLADKECDDFVCSRIYF